ncbi:hypothetical protein NVV94_20750 [Pseudomonas sp. LS1212]|uniref:MFS transporter n=1 Tax=Pseudomonas sp. LS1212 TaxID=2972478 RepID=UPI00215CAFDB|nr:MFS transporter [Pseudomonas sp. LS1212]UVJ42986.1 hypothetical protein NVV94_20750 [Pseudomonas sp. LS1212]
MADIKLANAWRILFLLFLANLFNFFDRTIPAIIIEPIRMEWHLSDFQLGIIGTAFTIVYALAGLPLGGMADTGSCSKLMGWGLAVWSGLTAVNGLVGLTVGGWMADKIHQRVANGRLLFAAASMLVATVATAYALHAGRIEIGVFVALFSIGWLFAYNFYTCVYTAIQDVVQPRLRATAMALYFAGLYLLGGGLGPVVVGLLSDHFAQAAMLEAGAGQMTEAFKAVGLHDAMYLIPVAMLLTLVFLLQASRCFSRDAQRMREWMVVEGAGVPAAI